MKSFLVADLAFGDCAKGATTDKLCREYPVDLVVRYNGGCQAAHNVTAPNGDHHTFAQFGSGMLANNKVRTYLSRFMLVEPFAMIREAQALSRMTDDVWERTTVDGRAVVTTGFHRDLNRLREDARGVNEGVLCQRHGSCGRGIGVTRELELKFPGDVLRVEHLKDINETAHRLLFTYAMLAAEINSLSDQLGRERLNMHLDDFRVLAEEYQQWPAKIVDGLEPAETMVFEGAQGVMLDETHGTAPHNTWTNTTFANANTLLDEIGCTDKMRIGCLRTYYTRHGAGPFPTEDNSLDLPEPHNLTGKFQGAFRIGHFDFSLAKRALSIVGGVDVLSISHLDYLPRLGWTEDDFLASIEANLRTPIGMLGRGPTAAHRTIELEVTA